MTPFHKKVAKSGTNSSRHTRKVTFFKKSSVEIVAAAAAADPWRGLGANDGAAVPVSGGCASAA